MDASILTAIITAAKEVTFSSALVCQQDEQKLVHRFSQNSVQRWHVGHERNH